MQNISARIGIAVTLLVFSLSACPALAQQADSDMTDKAASTVQVNPDGNAALRDGNVSTNAPPPFNRVQINDGDKLVSISRNGVQRNYLVRPDGAFRIGDDGSTQPVDPAELLPPLGAKPGRRVFGAAGQNINPGGGPLPTGKGPVDLSQMRQQLDDSLKSSLGCTDDEWATLWPRIQKIQLLQGAVMPGPYLGVSKDGDSLPVSVSDVRASLEEFQKILASKDVENQQITQALGAVRDARSKAKSELIQARKELTELVTPKQAAVLYQRGILD